MPLLQIIYCICLSARHPRFKMSEEQQPESNQPAPTKSLPPRRRGRRGGRGRRHPAPAVLAAKSLSQTESPAKQTEPPIRLREEMPVRPAPSKQKFQPAVSAPFEPAKEQFHPATKNDPNISAISHAVHEVTEIVESLRQSLAQMEEVLELVELAERQKITDEREIESLLRALRQFQSRGERPERQEHFNRPERQNRPNRPERPQRHEPAAKFEPPENLEHSETVESAEQTDSPEPHSED